MDYNRRVTLGLVLIFTLLLIIIGLERATLASNQFRKLNQASLQQ